MNNNIMLKIILAVALLAGGYYFLVPAQVDIVENEQVSADQVTNAPHNIYTIYEGRAIPSLADQDQNNDEQDNEPIILDGAGNTYKMRPANPFLADMLDATPVGESRTFSISAEDIPESASGFEARDYIIELHVKQRLDGLEIPGPADHIPDDATMTDNGMGVKFLTQNPAGQHPTLNDDIEVNYNLWQTDGIMYHSSELAGGGTDTFPLGRLIAGWQEALPLMRTGERAVIWIPGALAYDLREDRPYAPKGMLIFEVELVSIPGPSVAPQE